MFASAFSKLLPIQVTHDRKFHFTRDSDGMNVRFGVVANVRLTHDLKFDVTKESKHNIRHYKRALQYGDIIAVTGQRVPSQRTPTLASSSPSSASSHRSSSI